MMRLVFLSIVLLSACAEKLDKQEQVVIDRVEFLVDLKSRINEKIWDGFNDSQFDLPLIYYTESAYYFVNPTDIILEKFNPKLIFEKSQVKIYKSQLLDSIAFHMETSIDYTVDSDEYKSPVMHASSFEIVKKNIEDVNSTEMWSTMVLHEYFHGFQFKHLNYQNHIQNSISYFRQDSLSRIYKSNSWFKTAIDTENNFLLEAIEAKNSNASLQLIDSFFASRSERRLKTNESLKIDLAQVESIYETMEGSARYVEIELYKLFSSNSRKNKKIDSDKSFKNYKEFKDFDFQKAEWIYLTNKTKYCYATGFNMIRLLEKLDVEFKSRIFKEEDMTLEKLLLEYRLGQK
ncbi:MAG: hypothetical protein PHQ74_00445 [Crocinitomicaceae bacterium]|nr:hypothetical protein [Crocinitomicaceae bacterium]